MKISRYLQYYGYGHLECDTVQTGTGMPTNEGAWYLHLQGRKTEDRGSRFFQNLTTKQQNVINMFCSLLNDAVNNSRLYSTELPLTAKSLWQETVMA